MEILDTAVSAAVIGAVGLILSFQFRSQIRDLRREMNQRFDQVDRRFEEVDRRFEEVDQRFERLEARLGTRIDSNTASLRSDILRVALAVGAGPSAEAGTQP